MIKSYLKNDALQILIIGYPRLEDTQSKIAVLSSDYADTAENEPSEILKFGSRPTTDRGPCRGGRDDRKEEGAVRTGGRQGSDVRARVVDVVRARHR